MEFGEIQTAEKAKEQLDETLLFIQAQLKANQSKFLKEVADAHIRWGDAALRMLRRLYSLRRAKSLREFHEYTTKPCGCYFDPGGHP